MAFVVDCWWGIVEGHAPQEYDWNGYKRLFSDGLRVCSLLISEMQFAKENPFATNLPQLKVKNQEEVTEEAVTTTLRRSLSFYSTIQAHDEHWAGDYGGPMFLLPGLIIALSITGGLNAVMMCRYLYNHQNEDGEWALCIWRAKYHVYHIKLHSCPLLFLRARLLSMATTEAKPEAKPEPKEIEENSEPLLKYKGRHLPDILRHRPLY
ncbi:hypothetical protein ACFX2F_035160 [Malus domestica]